MASQGHNEFMTHEWNKPKQQIKCELTKFIPDGNQILKLSTELNKIDTQINSSAIFGRSMNDATSRYEII